MNKNLMDTTTPELFMDVSQSDADLMDSELTEQDSIQGGQGAMIEAALKALKQDLPFDYYLSLANKRNGWSGKPSRRNAKSNSGKPSSRDDERRYLMWRKITG